MILLKKEKEKVKESIVNFPSYGEIHTVEKGDTQNYCLDTNRLSPLIKFEFVLADNLKQIIVK